MPDTARSGRQPVPGWSFVFVLFLVGGTIGAVHPGTHRQLLLAAATSGVCGLAVLAAPRWPRSAVLINGAGAAAYFAAGLDNGPIFLAVPLVSVLASRRARPRPLLTVLVPGLVLILAGLTVRVRVHDASAVLAFWQGSGLTTLGLGGCVLGWWLTDRRDGREDRARRTATEERLRMAQDLHDGVGHGLAVISMHAAVALHVLDRESAPRDADVQIRQSLEVIRDTGRESLDALRVQVAAISAGPGAPRRPAPSLPELDDLLDRVRTGGLAVTRRGEPGDVPDEVGRVVYAVVQESLTNVLRHARATRAGLTLTREGEELMVVIEDDGQAAEGAAGSGGGMGVAGMRDRVERLGGTLEAGHEEGGFVVRAHLPSPSRPPGASGPVTR